jgi:predicted O-methyltransferase YrrM
MLDPAVESLLQEFDKREQAEHELRRTLTTEEMLAQRNNFLISVGRETGTILNILAKEAGAKRILELGTSYGYSTTWLAEAARATGGKVISIDIDSKKQHYAREALARAGLASFVEFLAGDALKILPKIAGPFDFVLVDLWKDLYVPCLDLFYPKLAPGAIIVADNMLWPEYARADAARYREHVRAKPKIESILLPLGSGVELSRFTG